MELSDLFTTWAENYETYCRDDHKSDVALLIRWVEKHYAPVVEPGDLGFLSYCIKAPKDILQGKFEGCCPESTIAEAAKWLGDPANGWISKAEMRERAEEE